MRTLSEALLGGKNLRHTKSVSNGITFSKLKKGDTIIYRGSKGEIEKYKVEYLEDGPFEEDNVYTDKSNGEKVKLKLNLMIAVYEKFGLFVNGDDCWECSEDYGIAAGEENWEFLQQFASSHGLLK